MNDGIQASVNMFNKDIKDVQEFDLLISSNQKLLSSINKYCFILDDNLIHISLWKLLDCIYKTSTEFNEILQRFIIVTIFLLLAIGQLERRK